MCVIRSKSEKTESSDTMGNTKITEPELDRLKIVKEKNWKDVIYIYIYI